MKKNILFVFVVCLMHQLGFTQCYPDRHSTNFFDGWISCEKGQSPNVVRGNSHFIMYDYGKAYKLGQMKIWNTNDPSHLDWGMRDVVIDYSLDGQNWVEAGTFTFPQASGLSNYEGADGPFLNEIEARYLLITAVNNYGGDCYGLSEIKIAAEAVIISDVEDVVKLECVDITIYPNPFADKVTLSLAAGCTGGMRYTVYDATGKVVAFQTAQLIAGQQQHVEFGSDLPSGTYTLYLQYGDNGVQRTIVKMNRS